MNENIHYWRGRRSSRLRDFEELGDRNRSTECEPDLFLPFSFDWDLGWRRCWGPWKAAGGGWRWRSLICGHFRVVYAAVRVVDWHVWYVTGDTDADTEFLRQTITYLVQMGIAGAIGGAVGGAVGRIDLQRAVDPPLVSTEESSDGE